MALGPRDPAAATDLDAGQRVLTAGPPPERAAGTIILLHGRGATAADILSLYGELGQDTLSALAPEAAGNTWYPNSFLAPIESNQPYLNSALRRIESIVAELLGRGVAGERIFLLGFSQGACLTSEFIARHPRRYGGAIAFTGGLIGPPETPRDYPGSLAGTPVFLGTSDPDPHVPIARVEETREVLDRMGASVDLRRYPGMPHTINEDEIDAARELIQRALQDE
jgi:predicted esterase